MPLLYDFLTLALRLRKGDLAPLGLCTAFPGILQASSFPWRSDNGYLFSIVMEVSGESHGNLTRTIKGTLRLKQLLRSSHTLAPALWGQLPARLSCPVASCVWMWLAQGKNPLPPIALLSTRGWVL